ncbi:hypothetical protein MGH68_19435 [Erysipelothrix sp. D19-032]
MSFQKMYSILHRSRSHSNSAFAEVASIHNASTGKIPVYHKTYIDELKIEDRHTKERIFAYNTSDTPPVMALDNNPNVLARTLYS